MPAKRRIKLEDGSKIAFFWVESAVVDKLYRIGPSAFTVYAVLCKYARNTTQDAYPSIQTIADAIGCSPTTVKKAIRILKEEKLVKVRQKGRPGREHNIYTLLEAAKIKGMTGSESDLGQNLMGSKSDRAGSENDRAGSESGHELEEVELDVLNQKESRTKHGTTDVVRDDVSSFSPERKDSSNLEGPAGTDKRQRQKPIPPKAAKHRPENHLFASAPRSSDEAMPADDYEWACDLFNSNDFEWRGSLSDKGRDEGGIRARWVETSGTRDERRRQFEDAASEAFNHSTKACSVLALMKEALSS